MKIAFCGKAKSGKTYAALYFQRQFGGYKMSFADNLKDKAYQLGWDGEKDERGRILLQDIGLAVRKYDEDYWAKLLRRDIQQILDEEKNVSLFVDDCRFPNEVEMLKKMGFSVWYLKTSNLPDQDAEWRNHESENLNPHLCAHWVHNVWGDIPAFEVALDDSLAHYLLTKRRT